MSLQQAAHTTSCRRSVAATPVNTPLQLRNNVWRSHTHTHAEHQLLFLSLSQWDEVSPASTGSGAEAFGPHEVVCVASLPAELTVQHRPVPVGRPYNVRETNMVNRVSIQRRSSCTMVSKKYCREKYVRLLDATKKSVQSLLTEKSTAATNHYYTSATT